MLKALKRAALLTAILATIGWGLFNYTTITIVALLVAVIFGWLTFVLYMDPPDEWS